MQLMLSVAVTEIGNEPLCVGVEKVPFEIDCMALAPASTYKYGDLLARRSAP